MTLHYMYFLFGEHSVHAHKICPAHRSQQVIRVSSD